MYCGAAKLSCLRRVAAIAQCKIVIISIGTIQVSNSFWWLKSVLVWEAVQCTTVFDERSSEQICRVDYRCHHPSRSDSKRAKSWRDKIDYRHKSIESNPDKALHRNSKRNRRKKHTQLAQDKSWITTDRPLGRTGRYADQIKSNSCQYKEEVRDRHANYKEIDRLPYLFV